MESQQQQQAQATEQPPRSKRRVVRRLLGSAAILVGVFLIVWFAFSPVVPQAAMKLVRGPDGKFTAQPQADESGPRFEVQSGKIEARNNFTSASSHAHGDHPRLACRTILVLNRSDHLLAKRIAGELLDELKQLDYVDQIEYLPRGEAPQAGVLSPS